MVSKTKTAGRPNRAAEVAEMLARAIYTEKIPPNAPLPSTRELAERYAVSQPTILAACDRLEAEDLIIRQNRRKIYVKAHLDPASAKEILYFSMDDNERSSLLSQAIWHLIEKSSEDGSFDFFTRLVSGFREGKELEKRLKIEVCKLEKLGFLDCAVVHAFGWTESAVNQCRKLPFPIVFLGDLEDGIAEKLNLWQIKPDCSGEASTIFRYAADHGIKRICLMYDPGCQRMEWGRRELTQYHDPRVSSGMSIDFLETPQDDRESVYGMLPEKLSDSREQTLLVMKDFYDGEIFSRNLLPREKFPQLSFLSTMPAPEYRGIKYLRYDFTAFLKSMEKMISDAQNRNLEPRQEFCVFAAEVAEENMPIEKKTK